MPGKTDSGYSFVYSLKRSGWGCKSENEISYYLNEIFYQLDH
jgi:hypothetical protein